MQLRSINPMDGDTLNVIEEWNGRQVEEAIQLANFTAPNWAAVPVGGRCALFKRLAEDLRTQRDQLAQLITLEMGKLITEARVEIEKCATVCDYYAENATEFLDNEVIESDAGNSYLRYEPLGVVLAIMPWNFPFWQVFRFAAPVLVAGNVGLLKHASNVPQCALAIEKLFNDAGFPSGVFQSVMISSNEVERVIAHKAVQAVTFTGSEEAGRRVAALAANNLKKSVLELGGSDPFIVLEDVEFQHAIKNAVASRFMNAGQSCIAAKRFIVLDEVADEFVALFQMAVENDLRPGNPALEDSTLAPMAQHRLRDDVHQQVTDSRARGARIVTGGMPGEGPGAYYQPSILDHVTPGMRLFDDEVFGPVAAIIRATDEQDAVRLANQTRFGLGGSVWTADSERGERIAAQLQSGSAFVNGMVKSDPRLPFGGVKASGYGRELSRHGLREFVNIKTVWVR